jgi:hypothetical protein
LPHKAFALQIRQNTGCKILPRCRTRRPSLQQKITMPLPAHKANFFYLISAEAVLLTNPVSINNTAQNKNLLCPCHRAGQLRIAFSPEADLLTWCFNKQ